MDHLGGHGDGGAEVNVARNMEEADRLLAHLKNAGIVAEIHQDIARIIIDDELAKVKADYTIIGEAEIARIKAEAMREAMKKSKGHKIWRYLIKPTVTVCGLGLLAYKSFDVGLHMGMYCGVYCVFYTLLFLPLELLRMAFNKGK